jgi:hypothetical protein
MGTRIANTEIGHQHPGDKGAHHVLRAMGEIDDVEQPEDDCESEAQERIERAVDQPKQHLAEQCLWRDAKKLEHWSSSVG